VDAPASVFGFGVWGNTPNHPTGRLRQIAPRPSLISARIGRHAHKPLLGEREIPRVEIQRMITMLWHLNNNRFLVFSD
jgi:hypothetical protein